VVLLTSGFLMFHKPKEWSKRYFLPEVAGILSALLGTHFIYLLNSDASIVAAAYSAAWAENIGYYSVIFFRDHRTHRLENGDAGILACIRAVIRNMIIEFGTAEVIDSFLLRPSCMMLGFTLFKDHSIATVFGKLIADIGFYAIAVCGYEFRKKLDKKTSAKD
jgi:hypothetical protein